MVITAAIVTGVLATVLIVVIAVAMTAVVTLWRKKRKPKSNGELLSKWSCIFKLFSSCRDRECASRG